MGYSFSEVFGSFDADESVRDSRIEKLKIDKEKRAVELTVFFPSVQNRAGIDDIEKKIMREFSAEKVVLTPNYPETTLIRSGVEEAVEVTSELFPAVKPLLGGCETEISDGVITVTLKNGGAEMMNVWRAKLEKTIFSWYGKPVTVKIKNGEVVGDSIEQLRTEKSKAIQKAVSELKDTPRSEKKAGKNRVILGRDIKDDYMDISDISLDTGYTAVCGDVFAVSSRDIPKSKATVVSFDITDYTGSIRISSFLESDKAAPIIAAISPGVRVAVSGKLAYNRYEDDVVMTPTNIVTREPLPQRQDLAEEKRVELHFHTRMSNMDAVVGAKEAVARAAQWGHRAVAITDHGVVHAFPEAMQAADKVNKGKPEEEKIKVLYGAEAYYVNDYARVKSVYGTKDALLGEEFVAFDIETTGLSSENDAIIEIGAVLFKAGEIIDTFNTFVDPGRPIPLKITELTGITDSMVRGAPELREALNGFLEFAGDRILAAHNATFDVGFISKACSRLNISYSPTFMDTRNMARGLLNNISKYDLHTVAVELGIPAFNHHRASDDAGAVAYILENFIKLLKAGNITNVSEINGYLGQLVSGNVKKLTGSNHMLILVKNEEGLRSLYELISDSHLKYYRRNPMIPRSLLDKHREGLILGSACESGELFKAIVDRRPREELKELASYYDFLEIQPLGNNEFLTRSGKAADMDELAEFNKLVVSLGEELNIPVAATCDVHFMEPRDEIYRRVMMKGKGFDDADSQPPLYFRTTEEMLEEFSYLGKEKAYEVVVKNTNLIADMCENIRPVREGTFSPEIEGSAEELKSLVESKLKRLYGDNPHERIRARVDEELNAIIKHHFDVIYMIAQKLVTKSLEDGYLVGSRGSVGSSVVAYFSDITEVNALPVHYRCPSCKNHEFYDKGDIASGPDLPDKECPVCGGTYEKDGFDIPFATFLGFDGDKKPDIDLNFSGEYQARAHRETVELFGEGYVFRAGTIGTLAEKTAYGFVKKYMEEKGSRVSKAEENRIIQGIVGVKRSTGQHPGGLIVVPKGNSIYEFTPVQRPADDVDSDIITTHFDYHSIEENLLKLDLLGHDDPTMARMLFDLTGVDPQKIPLDDKETMSLFTSTKTLGFTGDKIITSGTCAVPEYGTKFVREMLSLTKPTSFDELIRISGLSHGTDVWLNNGKDHIDSGKATLKEIIACRDDIMNYLISMGVEKKSAFTMSESVRKGRGLKPEWEENLRKQGIPEWYLESCHKIKYMFPKAHAAAYVLMAFRIAWYKVHYPLEFYAAYFTIRANAFDAELMTEGIEKVRARINEINLNPNPKPVERDMLVTLEIVYEFYLRGFKFNRMDIYRSDVSRFLVEEGALLPPFTSIPGIGESVAQIIVNERENGEFISAEDMTLRCPKVSTSIIELLKTNGALADMPMTSQVMLF
jgi:DNA polymerase-3 subunit alpha (Gram-positive type)